MAAHSSQFTLVADLQKLVLVTRSSSLRLGPESTFWRKPFLIRHFSIPARPGAAPGAPLLTSVTGDDLFDYLFPLLPFQLWRTARARHVFSKY